VSILLRGGGGDAALIPSSPSLAGYGASQALGIAELAALAWPCGRCKAGEWQLCLSGTGLPSAVPCAGRGKAAA
jgi:hypothetical protein